MFVAVIILFALIAVPSSQGLDWPEFFSMPDSVPRKDSSGLAIRSEQNYYLSTLRGGSHAEWQALSERIYFSQSITHANQATLPGPARQEQKISFPGRVIGKQLVSSHTSLGIDWQPTLEYKSYYGKQGIGSRTEVGPVVSTGLFPLDLTLRTGYSMLGWNEDPGQRITAHDIRNSRGDQGGYGAISVGQPNKSIAPFPLYVHGAFYGRKLEYTSLLTGYATALSSHGFSTRDSLFASVSDSLDHGVPAELIGDNTGVSFFISPPRTFRSTAGGVGLKGAPRLGLSPAAAYVYSRISSQYPSEILKDRRNQTHSASMYLSSDSAVMPMLYRGAIRLEFEDEDKIYGTDYFDVPDSLRDWARRINLRDYRGFRAIMSHHGYKRFDNGSGCGYAFSLSRYSREYPRDTVADPTARRGTEDNHLLEQGHRLWYDVIRRQTANAALYGEFSRIQQVFLTEMFSGSNSTTRKYRLGGNAGFTVRALTISTDLRAEASSEEFAFPQVHAFSFPPYSRVFFSLVGVRYRLGNHHSAYVAWREFFNDNGYRFDPVYVDTAKLSDPDYVIPAPYYAVERWKRVHGWDVGMESDFPGVVALRAGVNGEYSRDREFQGELYVPSVLDGTIRLGPYFDIKTRIRRGTVLDAKLAPIFEIIRRGDSPVFRSYWDARLVVGVTL